MITTITGAQWGDEGKAKIVDFITTRDKYDYVVRFSGGANAGHTVVYNGKKYVSHLLPSAIFNADKCFIGSGCAVDIFALEKEIAEFNPTSPIYLSPKAHLVLEIYKGWEAQLENVLNIGTTKKGIGQTYAMKALRGGIRVIDLLDSNHRTRCEMGDKLWAILGQNFDDDQQEYHALLSDLQNVYYVLSTLVDSNIIIVEDLEPEMRANKFAKILLEGAQGVQLDINSDTYPYVTSSMTTTMGAIAQAGLTYKNGVHNIGIFKPYITKVGEGDFITEIVGDLADTIIEKGKEYGSTTGRKRRVGWLNLIQLKEACLVNAYDSLCMMKVDVLFGLGDINVYGEKGYFTVKGFNSVEDVEFFEFVRIIEEYVGVKIDIVSYGPDREETLLLGDKLHQQERFYQECIQK